MRLALSTNSGGPNQPAGGGGGGSFITSGIHLVTTTDGSPVALTSSAYQAVLGDRISIVYDGTIRLFAERPRQFASGTISPNIHLVE